MNSAVQERGPAAGDPGHPGLLEDGTAAVAWSVRERARLRRHRKE